MIALTTAFLITSLWPTVYRLAERYVTRRDLATRYPRDGHGRWTA